MTSTHFIDFNFRNPPHFFNGFNDVFNFFYLANLHNGVMKRRSCDGFIQDLLLFNAFQLLIPMIHLPKNYFHQNEDGDPLVLHLALNSKSD